MTRDMCSTLFIRRKTLITVTLTYLTQWVIRYDAFYRDNRPRHT